MNHPISRLAALVLAAAVGTAVAADPAPKQPSDAGSQQGLLGPVPGSAEPIEGSAAAAGQAPTAASAPARTATQKPTRPTALADMPTGLGFEGALDAGDAERIVYQRAPIRIVLSLARERLVTFPGPIAFHAPEGFDTLIQSQLIDRTAYLKALAPFGTLRVVAEDLTNGRLIPIDLVVDAKSKTAMRPIEVMVPGQVNAGSAVAAEGSGTGQTRAAAPAEPPALDMVGLTRYAAQSLYAPRRLVPAIAGVKQLPIATIPVEGIYRGWRVQTTPIGAWRSGQLYVTAVRFTNQGQQPLDIDLQEMRGRWLAATAQHTRLLAAGSDWSTTTVYLVCDRPFDACR